MVRRAGIVALIGTLLGLGGGFYSVKLYQNLRTDIHELLPSSARSVLDLKEVSSRLRSIDSLAVLIFSSHPEESKRFITDLAEVLEKAPKSIVAGVEYRIDRELKFFQERQALYLNLDDLMKIKTYIHDKIEYEKELYNPLNIFKEVSLPEPSLNFIELKKKYQKDFSTFEHLPSGFYANRDETHRLILVKLPGEATGITGANLLKSTVETAIHKLNPQSYAPDIDIKFTGDVQALIEEQTALVEDLEISTVAVSIVVTLGMLLFYKTLRATFALMLSLIMGTLWTFGLSYFAVGYLNANSAFLGSIIIGNGINFGIIYLARYLEERRNSLTPLQATQIAMTTTATSTWTAALAAGLSYGSLILTGFRGFKQFGIIGLIGMVVCWISAFTVLPAYLILFERSRSLISRAKHQPKAYVAGKLAQLIQHHPKLICSISLALTLVSALTFKNFSPDLLETDLTRLRNRESIESGANFHYKFVEEILLRDLSPIVLLPKKKENAIKIVEALRNTIKTSEQDTFIDSAKTLDDFVPQQQAEKIQILRQIKALLNPRILSRLSPADKLLVDGFLTPAVFQPMKVTDLPPLVLDSFREKDGSIGKLVIVDPKRANRELANGDNLIRFVNTLRAVGDEIEPGVAVAGSNAVVADMILAIASDGPKATLFAFIAVILLVIVLFRNLKTISLVLFALILGVLWLAGIILGLHIKINFLNFIALPITFGIGVDYGVNIFHRYRENPRQSILTVIKSTGSAVGLCSFSTITGYVSLLIARNQGFVSFGTLAVAGELTCVVAALISLPALIHWGSRRKMKAGL
jgi:predicted RND superfamily exporter protein